MRLIKALAAISLVASAANAAAGPIKLTFDGLGQADNTLMRDQYAGQGVNFFFNAVLAGDKGSYSNIGKRPSGDTVLGLVDLDPDLPAAAAFWVNVKDGFEDLLSLSYLTNQSSGSLRIFDGLDGQGKLLREFNLSNVVQENCGAFSLCTWRDIRTDFEGKAHSVVFQGGNRTMFFDDMVFGAAQPPVDVPEPASLALVAAGFGAALLGMRRRKRA